MSAGAVAPRRLSLDVFDDIIDPEAAKKKKIPVDPNSRDPGDFSDIIAQTDERASRTWTERAKRAALLTGGSLAGGALGTVATLGGGAADAVAGVARDVAYQGHRGLAATGAVNPPQESTYYNPEGSKWPVMEAASRGASRVRDAIQQGYEPETRDERLGAAALEGVGGAAATLGVGGVLAGAPGAAGRFGTSLASQPGAQIVSGAASGAAGQGVREAGGGDKAALAASLAVGAFTPLALARTGRMKSTTAAGSDAIAADILRARASNPQTAAQSARDIQAGVQVPGFRHKFSDAARDPGIAGIKQSLDDFSAESGNNLAAVKENNQRILSHELNRRGALPGTADRTRARAQRLDNDVLADMDLVNQPEVDVTDLMSQVQARTQVRGSGQGSTAAGGHRELFNELRGSARVVEIPGATPSDPPTVQYFMNPADLYAARKEIQALRNAGGQIPAGSREALVRNSGRETRWVTDEIDRHLDDVTGGRFAEYLRQSRKVRTRADRHEYMENFREKVSPSGQLVDENVYDIQAAPWLSTVANKGDMPLPGGKRTMAMEDLDTGRRSFLGRAYHDLNNASYAERVRAKSGSPTVPKGEFNADIEARVLAGRGPVAKGVEQVSKAGRALGFLGAGLTAGAGGGASAAIPAAAGYGLQSFGQGIARRGVSEAVTRVRARLGQIEGNPNAGADLLEAPGFYNPGLGETAGIMSRQSAIGLGGGFLADDRNSRYR